VTIYAPREFIGKELAGEIVLEDYDGTIILADEQPCRFGFDIDPSGIVEGLESPVVHPFAFNLPPLRLEAGREYRFRLSVDGETRDHWIAPFRTTSE